jgi:adenylate cyclase
VAEPRLIRLKDIERCLRGSVPATMATCSPDGTPNATYLSIVSYVDDDHIALSNQFFNKSRENLMANPWAQVLVPDAATMVQYRLTLRYERTDDSGPTFERMRTVLDAIASEMGMADVFKLRCADICRVTAIEELAHDLILPEPDESSAHFVEALDTLSVRLSEREELDGLLTTALTGLDELFGYEQAFILLADGEGKRLYTVASHGFEDSGIGAEIAFGEGLIGVAARERRVVKVSNLLHAQTMADAVRQTARERGHQVSARDIRMPGLPHAQSIVAVPILARDRALGVLCVQGALPGRFTTDDERVLATVARYLAASILLVVLAIEDVLTPIGHAKRPGGALTAKIVHHASDDSIFIDDEYLIKGLCGRILLRLLSIFERDGRVDFTNKELRADERLGLAGYRDNLEARLILLRRRLEERSGTMRLVSTGRGRFRLELLRNFELLLEP